MSAEVSPSARANSQARRRDWTQGALRSAGLLPAVALLAMFMLGPAIWALYGSLTNAALTGKAALAPRFIGLKNYTDLAADGEFIASIGLTVLFTLASAVIGQNLLGLGIALLQRVAGQVVRTLVGIIVVGAWVLPEIVAAFALYAFFADGGTLNAVLSVINIGPVQWLYAHPMLSVILANVWRGTAFSMMVYAAALTEVPPEINEAAEVDGATGWQRLVHITLPMIRRSIATNLMLITLQTLSVFTLIYVMTAGGPGTDSSTLPVLAYQVAFQFGKVGYGTAIATVMLIIGALFSMIYIRLLRTEAIR